MTGASTMSLIESGQPAESLAELLSLHDRAFVRCAYLTLLGRPVDPDGMTSYLRLVRRGERKIAIVSRLVRSREGCDFDADLPGLAKGLANYRRSRWPLVGRLFLLARKSDGDSSREYRLRALENAIHAHAADMFDKLDKLETVVASRISGIGGGDLLLPGHSARMVVKPVTTTPAQGGFVAA
ncbi:hypothetical protein [Novosphingobium resinovorum]|uniref:hypothetical protein n=1 Tax=Novosphingobium resinovorum TaxID=158500 RepID=UPI002ED3876B|nr:hypothetical protein [Novosphingobium resinovorum]